MELKREIIDQLSKLKITKFILITENVLNFHSSDKEYYQEWFEEVTEENGWIVALNMPEATQQDFRKKKLNYYIELMEIADWRIYKPYHLFRKIDDQISKRIGL
jgi:MFS superfamily sulfate permease-like transporter